MKRRRASGAGGVTFFVAPNPLTTTHHRFVCTWPIFCSAGTRHHFLPDVPHDAGLAFLAVDSCNTRGGLVNMRPCSKEEVFGIVIIIIISFVLASSIVLSSPLQVIK